MEKRIKEITGQIRETAFELHKYIKHGHLEKVYENGLAHRLEKKGFKVQKQVPLQVRDDDETILGDYFADLVINDFFIIELKACKTLLDEHIAQILGYMRACSKEHGMLINFGSSKLQVKKYILSQDI